MKKAALHNLGCKVNAYETEAMQEMLEQAGYEIVPFKEGADVYVINTCTVTNIADRKSRQMLHRAKVAPDNGVLFGPQGEGDGFLRLNFACPRAQLRQALTRMADALGGLNTYPYRYIYDNMAIFSRLPFVGQGHLSFPKERSGACLYVDVPVGDDTLRVYNVYLESYRFSREDRAFIQNLGQGVKEGNLSDGTRHLASRFALATRNRAKQAQQISRHLCRAPYPVVLCGDFNDTPLSYTYRQMKIGLKDAFTECGRGLGNTYIGEFPSFRIDYILHSPEITALSYLRDTLAFSDHYPIRCSLRLR